MNDIDKKGHAYRRLGLHYLLELEQIALSGPIGNERKELVSAAAESLKESLIRFQTSKNKVEILSSRVLLVRLYLAEGNYRTALQQVFLLLQDERKLPAVG